MTGEHVADLVFLIALGFQESSDRVPKGRIGQQVGRACLHRQIAALDLVLPLGSSLDPGKAVFDREIDGAVIA